MSGLLDNAKVGDKLIMTSRWNRTTEAAKSAIMSVEYSAICIDLTL